MKVGVGLLGELEWAVMKTCWDKGKTTARIIFEEIKKTRNIQYQTIKTTLDRLVQKGYLVREKFGPIWLYSSTVTETTLTSKAIESFAQTVFGNAIAPVFIHLLKKKKYTHEIEELKKIINEIEEED
ncbi:BlaI/MecI/CopY family transcriptional regulator [bacterium]|nr:BlaI/MecI/CopY family transcriptional regulator [bacterium]